MEVLTEEEIEYFINHRYVSIDAYPIRELFSKALNTIKLQRLQLAQREAEVAAMHDVLKQWGACKTGTEEEKVFNSAMHIKHNLQATAEAHDAKVREQAIRECMEKMKGFWENPDAEHPYLELEALLNKPEGEGV